MRKSIPFLTMRLAFDADDDTDDLDGPEYEYTLEEAYGEREAEAAAWRFNTAARKVNLSGERLRFPAGLTAATKEWLIEVKLPEIDRRIENGASLYDKRDKERRRTGKRRIVGHLAPDPARTRRDVA